MKPTLTTLLALCLYLGGFEKKEPIQSPASNTEAIKPETSKAKVSAGDKLWEFETGDGLYSSLAKSPWPMRGQNPHHTGRAPTSKK